MHRRFCGVLVLALLWTAAASAQVVRFDTTVGDFDMVLNPTNNPLLEGHVDNLLQYIDDNRYKSSWINRAAENFVLQMGGFYSHTRRPPPTIVSTRNVVPFDPVPGQPGIPGLSNTVGTVSLALPSGPGGALPDAGTSSFFINLSSNAFLDPDFTVFAAISDMTVVNEIMALMQVDRTAEPDFGAGAGNLAFSDVPVDENGFQVFIRRAFVIDDAMAVAQARASVAPIISQSITSAGGGSSASLGPSTAVPEPASGAMLLLGMLWWLRRRR